MARNINIALSDVAYELLCTRAKRNGCSPTKQARLDLLAVLPPAARVAEAQSAPKHLGPAPIERGANAPINPARIFGARKLTKAEQAEQLRQAVRNTGGR